MNDTELAHSTAEVFEQVTTERLVLRRPTLADIDDAWRIHGDPRTNTFNPSGPDPDREASERRVRSWLDHWESHRFGYWTVLRREGGGVIGFAGLRHERWLSTKVLNLYYRFGPEAWGHGFATEAARAAVKMARAAFPELPLFARTTKDNLPSQRTALAAGFVRRPDLDASVDGHVAVIFTLGWPAVS